MKIAIFHDFFDSIGGGEKVAASLARHLKADLITTNLNPDTIKKMEYGDIKFINLVDTIKMPPLKQLQASFLFSKCNFSKDYDFFIFSGNWAPFAAKKHKPNLYYCHTPTRVFYDSYHLHIRALPKFKRRIFRLYALIHKKWGEKYISDIDNIIANSKNVQKRVEKYLKRKSTIINPPIETSKFKYKKHKNYWFSVNRIYPHKRVEIQINAFKNLPNEKLIIVGGIAPGDAAEKYLKEMMKNSPPNVRLLGKVSEEKLIQLYSECKGFITTSQDEDFGMTPVEAMASGKPVIAPNEGGYKETIIDRKTGILINDINSNKLVGTIKKLGREINKNPLKFKRTCQERAKKFDTKVFIKKIKEEIKNIKNA